MENKKRYQLEAKYMDFDNKEILDMKTFFTLLNYGHFLQAKDENNKKISIFKYKRSLYVYKTKNDILETNFVTKEEFIENMFSDFILLKKVNKKFMENLCDFHVKFSFMNINREILKYIIKEIKMGIHTVKKNEYTLVYIPEISIINSISTIGENSGKYEFRESLFYASKKFQEYKSIILAFTYTKSSIAYTIDKGKLKLEKEKFDELVNQLSETQTEELDNIRKKPIEKYKENKKYYPNSMIFIICVGILYLYLNSIINNLQRGGLSNYFFVVLFGVLSMTIFLKYHTVDRRKENLIIISIENNRPFETSMYYPKPIDIIRFIFFIIVVTIAQLDGIIPFIIYLLFIIIYVESYRKLYKKYTGDGKD